MVSVVRQHKVYIFNFSRFLINTDQCVIWHTLFVFQVEHIVLKEDEDSCQWFWGCNIKDKICSNQINYSTLQGFGFKEWFLFSTNQHLEVFFTGMSKGDDIWSRLFYGADCCIHINRVLHGSNNICINYVIFTFKFLINTTKATGI